MTQLSKMLIPKVELDILIESLTKPKAVCQRCDGKEDCIGIEECFPSEYFHVIELTITDPAENEIREMIFS